MSSDFQSRLAAFQSLLHPENSPHDPVVIDLDAFRKLCLNGGCPDNGNLRPRAWKLLLGYLPPDQSRWGDDCLKEKREMYYSWLAELLDDNWQKQNNHDHTHTNGDDTTNKVDIEDHPLNDTHSSKWNNYFNDNTILEQIDKDVRRTLPEIGLFQQRAATASTKTLPNRTNRSKSGYLMLERIRNINKDFGVREHASDKKDDKETNGNGDHRSDQEELHWEVIEKILFVYAKLNPGIGYVQGMNEILAPIYYVLARNEDLSEAANCEADCFYLFTAVMTGLRDIFSKNMDNESKGSGVAAVLSRFMTQLNYYDPELHSDLNEKGVIPSYYAFRWFTCLCACEFDLPDVIRLWDTLFAAQHLDQNNASRSDDINEQGLGHFDFLTDFCCAMLIRVRSELLDGSFVDNIKLLQHYPSSDLSSIVRDTFALRDGTLKVDRKISMDRLSTTSSISSNGSTFKPSSLYSAFSRSNLSVSSWKPSDQGSLSKLKRQSVSKALPAIKGFANSLYETRTTTVSEVPEESIARQENIKPEIDDSRDVKSQISSPRRMFSIRKSQIFPESPNSKELNSSNGINLASIKGRGSSVLKSLSNFVANTPNGTDLADRRGRTSKAPQPVIFDASEAIEGLSNDTDEEKAKRPIPIIKVDGQHSLDRDINGSKTEDVIESKIKSAETLGRPEENDARQILSKDEILKPSETQEAEMADVKTPEDQSGPTPIGSPSKEEDEIGSKFETPIVDDSVFAIDDDEDDEDSGDPLGVS